MQKLPLHKSSGRADVKAALLTLDQKQLHAVLATDSGGQPYTSLVAFAMSGDGKGVIFATPRKTSKYKNILRNRNVSFMIDTRANTSKSYMKAEAVTIIGRATPLKKGKRRDALCRIYIEKHPPLAGFARAPSTALVLVTIRKAIHASRFQTVTEWEV